MYSIFFLPRSNACCNYKWLIVLSNLTSTLPLLDSIALRSTPKHLHFTWRLRGCTKHVPCHGAYGGWWIARQDLPTKVSLREGDRLHHGRTHQDDRLPAPARCCPSRPAAEQHPVRHGELHTRVDQDIRLWFCKTDACWKWTVDDAVLHSEFCCSWGEELWF